MKMFTKIENVYKNRDFAQLWKVFTKIGIFSIVMLESQKCENENVYKNRDFAQLRKVFTKIGIFSTMLLESQNVENGNVYKNNLRQKYVTDSKKKKNVT